MTNVLKCIEAEKKYYIEDVLAQQQNLLQVFFF